MRSASRLASATLGLLLVACNSDTTPETTSQRWYNSQHAASGEQLYARHCTTCHGVTAAGATDWRHRSSDGSTPPPPLNGSGHAWHHPLRQLHDVIKHGSPGGKGNMPAWEGVLSDGEILAIIAWFQSHWPDEIYAAWLRNNGPVGGQ